MCLQETVLKCLQETEHAVARDCLQGAALAHTCSDFTSCSDRACTAVVSDFFCTQVISGANLVALGSSVLGALSVRQVPHRLAF